MKKRKKCRNKMCSINHDLKAIFIHIPKTAGTFLADILHTHYGFKKYYIKRPDHLQFTGKIDTSVKCHENFIHGTLMYYKTSPYCNAKMGMTPEKWDEYYKFCFIRNPYDKIISGWNYVAPKISFEQYIQKPKQKSCWDYWHVFMPQVRHIINEKGKIGVDFIGRFEHLEEDFGKVLEKLDLIKRPLTETKKNARKHLPYQVYYQNQQILDRVNQLLQEDFTLLQDYYPKINTTKELYSSSSSSSSSPSSSSSS